MTTHYERRGEVAVLQIDNPPVNGLGHATRKALLDGLERALDDSGGQGDRHHRHRPVFSGGADIREFNTPAALAEPNLLQLIDAVERFAQAGDRRDQRRVHGRRPRALARLQLPRSRRPTRRWACPK